MSTLELFCEPFALSIPITLFNQCRFILGESLLNVRAHTHTLALVHTYTGLHFLTQIESLGVPEWCRS